MLWSGRQKGCVLREISSWGIVSAVKIYQTWLPVEKIMGCFWWGGVLDQCEEGVSKVALQSGIDNVEFIVCTKERWAGSTATFYFEFYVLLHLLKKTWRRKAGLCKRQGRTRTDAHGRWPWNFVLIDDKLWEMKNKRSEQVEHRCDKGLFVYVRLQCRLASEVLAGMS